MTSAAPTLAGPYLDWAQRTAFSGHAAVQAQPTGHCLPLLVRSLEPASALVQQVPGLKLSPTYLDRAELNSQEEPWPAPASFTAWARVEDLARLDAALQGQNQAATRARGRALTQTESASLALALPVQGSPAVPPGPRAVHTGIAVRQSPAPLLIGVIDSGCAFLNAVFRRDSEDEGARHTRLHSLWQQRPGLGLQPPWQVPTDMAYGRELLAHDIDALLAQADAPRDEQGIYRRLGYPVDTQGQLLQELHGTQVLDIAAGLDMGLPESASAKPAAPDAASQAALIFVDVPSPGADDSTGVGVDAYLLDALHYILARAAPGARVVINISMGSLAGPHDGGSLIELAIDELLTQHPELTITLAAGNGAEESWHARGHTGPGPKATPATVHWRTMPRDATDSFLELWLFADQASDFNDLVLTLQAPDGRLLKARPGEAHTLAGPGGSLASLDWRPMPPHRGRARMAALVALAPSDSPVGSRRSKGLPAGAWQLSLVPGLRTGRCEVQAWLQRDTPGRQLGPLLQSTIEAVSGDMHIDGLKAVSSLATGLLSVVVGAQRLNNGSRSPYSPSEHVKVFAAADESAATGGLLCAGGLSGSLVRMSGTSAAAPMVARALANRPYPTSNDMRVAWGGGQGLSTRFSTGELAQTAWS